MVFFHAGKASLQAEHQSCFPLQAELREAKVRAEAEQRVAEEREKEAKRIILLEEERRAEEGREDGERRKAGETLNVAKEEKTRVDMNARQVGVEEAQKLKGAKSKTSKRDKSKASAGEKATVLRDQEEDGLDVYDDEGDELEDSMMLSLLQGNWHEACRLHVSLVEVIAPSPRVVGRGNRSLPSYLSRFASYMCSVFLKCSLFLIYSCDHVPASIHAITYLYICGHVPASIHALTYLNICDHEPASTAVHPKG